jgi:two-component system, chemotaxis family, response regulator Rcp1
MTKDKIQVLLVEDNPTDVLITQEALDLARISINLHVVENGEEAMAFLRREGNHVGAPRPNLIMLDLNMPGKHGQDVLVEIKSDEKFKAIPVVILTTSKSPTDIKNAYGCHANCYIAKPVDFEAFAEVIRTIQKFWFTMVMLPTG